MAMITSCCRYVYKDITPIIENQAEIKMENEMETGIITVSRFEGFPEPGINSSSAPLYELQDMTALSWRSVLGLCISTTFAPPATVLGLSFSGSHGASSITKQMQTYKALTRLKSLVTDVFVVHIGVHSMLLLLFWQAIIGGRARWSRAGTAARTPQGQISKKAKPCLLDIESSSTQLQTLSPEPLPPKPLNS